ncbi:ribosomal-protein-alanine N-acetyltransferase RimI, partial [Dolichospermum sp. ST_sed9]|nr:ribosomal-protein-alanine N-acetyltransferase RimI [Dolichospermum sp. ST_sed9]
RGYYKDNNEDALILWLSELQQPRFLKNLDQWASVINSPF